MNRKLLLALTLIPIAILARAQGTAFTYQGRLSISGTNYSGLAEIQPALWNAANGGSQVAANNPASDFVEVTNGLFTLPLDFGGSFSGASLWLQLNVRVALGPFTALTPRQALTPAPYAIMAGTASNLLGTVPAAQLTGTIPLGQLPPAVVTNNASGVNITGVFHGSGAGLSGVDAARLDGWEAADFWRQGGNPLSGGQFLGSVNDQPLEFRVNNTRALRLEPTANGQDRSNVVNVVGGSPFNRISPGVYGSVIAGGGGLYSGVAFTNLVASHFSFLGGGAGNSIHSGSPYSVLGGGESSSILNDTTHAFLGGGYSNTILGKASWAFLGGGYSNTILDNASWAFLGGGYGNTIKTNAYRSFLGGGGRNVIETNSYYSFLGGGWGNTVQVSASYAVVGGGEGNVAAGWHSVVPGGYKNLAASPYSFAAGYQARAVHSGAWVWSDSSSATALLSTNAHSVTMRASGGYRLFSNPGATTGASLAPGGGSWTSMSDRCAKEDFEPINPGEILDKVTALPLTTWKYKSQDAHIRHLGPMAQDFKAAFGVGESDTGITSVDADGVALAAIQGLNQKVESETQQTALRMQSLEAENAALKARLEKLEQLLRASHNANQ